MCSNHKIAVMYSLFSYVDSIFLDPNGNSVEIWLLDYWLIKGIPKISSLVDLENSTIKKICLLYAKVEKVLNCMSIKIELK